MLGLSKFEAMNLHVLFMIYDKLDDIENALFVPEEEKEPWEE